jgi:hypothetical protein
MGEEGAYRVLVGKHEEKSDYLENPAVDGRIT